MVSIFFVALVLACGAALTRALQLPLHIAPLAGLAGLAVFATWCATLGAPPLLSSGCLAATASLGVISLFRTRGDVLGYVRRHRASLMVLAIAAAIPAVVLGIAFAGVQVPVSTHDGAFHVETIESLRRGVPLATWYPMGFHATVAAVLGILPWLDTARGTSEIGLGLAVLGPLALFALGLALGLDVLLSAVGATILAATFIYPYDYHLWGGWPQGMGVLLVVGLLVVALRWVQRPGPGWAILGAVFGAAIVLTHGTEVYSSLLVLGVVALARFRDIRPVRLVAHLPLALGLALVLAAPYLPALLGWASTGGAMSSGASFTVETGTASEEWLQFGLGITGAASLLDLPVRLVFIVLGVGLDRRLRLTGALWAAFVVLLALVQFVDLPPVRALFVVTFPWLADYRPREMAVLFGSLLGAAGLCLALGELSRWRKRMADHPRASRRLALACFLVLAFFAEGSAVGVYKRVTQAVLEQTVYNAEDGAAMAWLKDNALPGEMVANDQATDAGIWAPYKANLPILLPRSGQGSLRPDREAILAHAADLYDVPNALAAVCALHVGYLYDGVQLRTADARQLPDRAVLESAANLEEVFVSGQTALFRIHVACD